MNNIVKDLKKIKCGLIEEDVPLKKHNTYRIDGIIKVMVTPGNVDELKDLLNYLKTNNVKHMVLGKGSNVLFVNSKYDGVIIKLDSFDNLEIEDTIVKVGAGYSLIKLALKTTKLGLTGFEFAAGIPGTVGGAIFMNAGAYKSDMGYIVSEVKVLTPDNEVKTMYNKEMDFHYRTSFIQKNRGYICLEATIVLKHGDINAINSVMEDRKQRRLMSQPWDFPSAGSVFRNPEGDFAGRLIEAAGMKGKSIGGALVSEKHANFIVNSGGATGQDFYKLITSVKDVVNKEFKIELKVEQEFVE